MSNTNYVIENIMAASKDIECSGVFMGVGANLT